MSNKRNALQAMMSRSKSPENNKKRKTATAVGSPSPKGLQDLLGRLKNGLPGSYEEQQKKLFSVASDLMTYFELDINGKAWRISEVEAYVHHDTHKDVYTHRQPDQLESGSWYFHRQGNTGAYKGGTYKGLDLTMGNEETKMYCGFLIRSISSSGVVVEGPCLAVNKILELNQCDSIASFANGRTGKQLYAESTEGLTLKLSKTPLDKPVFSGPRVGLTLRSDPGKVKFCARAYRFSTTPAQIKKFKAGFAAVAVSEGLSTAAIMDAFNIKPRFANDYIAAAQKGIKSSDYSPFVDKVLSATEICEMFGATRKSF
eukprot:TRINITY_DN4651_c1_g1_i1.p1 TRINITY_DN4651_c1_g1~~TRINITY_DN4651_c1_g1_i1.p1  ORF type:complete len:331 (+),score=50.57 TRINITY_DN4651_c1_g1_i1:49-993(+)